MAFERELKESKVSKMELRRNLDGKFIDNHSQKHFHLQKIISKLRSQAQYGNTLGNTDLLELTSQESDCNGMGMQLVG